MNKKKEVLIGLIKKVTKVEKFKTKVYWNLKR